MGELYSKIASLCDNRGISAFKLCREIGMQPSVITELKKERTNSLSAKNLQKVATYFGVSVAYLLGEEEATQSGEDAATLQQLKDSPATRVMLHSLRDMSEDEIMAYANFIKTFRAVGEGRGKK